MGIFDCGTSCGNCGSPVFTQINLVAPANKETILDQLSLAEYCSVQWNLEILDPSQNKRRLSAIFATHEGGVTPFHNHISRIGSSLQNFDYTLNVDINLGSLRLKISNNSSEDYIIKIIRIPMEIFIP